MAKAAKKETAKKGTKDSKETTKKVAPKKAETKGKAPKVEAKKAAKKEASVKEKAPKAALQVVEAPSEVEAPVVEKAEKAPAEPKVKKSKKAAKEKQASEDSNRKWSELRDKHASEKAAAYSMSSVFEPNRPLQHKVLGWGWIVAVQNDRLEVLFEDGTKMLISNYKPS